MDQLYCYKGNKRVLFGNKLLTLLAILSYSSIRFSVSWLNFNALQIFSADASDWTHKISIQLRHVLEIYIKLYLEIARYLQSIALIWNIKLRDPWIWHTWNIINKFDCETYYMVLAHSAKVGPIPVRMTSFMHVLSWSYIEPRWKFAGRIF